MIDTFDIVSFTIIYSIGFIISVMIMMIRNELVNKKDKFSIIKQLGLSIIWPITLLRAMYWIRKYH